MATICLTCAQPVLAQDEGSSLAALAAGKITVFGSLADTQELQGTLRDLDKLGMRAVFVIPSNEAGLYPDKIKMLYGRGHSVILQTAVAQQSVAPAQYAPRSQQRRSSGDRVYENVNLAKREQAKEGTEADVTIDKSVGGRSALKTVGTNANNVVKSEIKPLTRKERISRDFYGTDENGRRVALRYPTRSKEESDVPDWSLLSMKKLSYYKLLLPTELEELLSEPNRELMAKLTARAYHENNALYGSNYYDAQFELERLMQEYDTELRNLGYEAGRYLSYGRLPQASGTKIGGELRYNYVNHGGDEKFDFFDSRVRLRLYAEQPLDDNWTLYGMGEANKSWFRDIKHFNLERIYIKGKYKELELTGGRFGAFYADGNIYDGHFDGVRASGGEKVKLTGEYGKLRDDEKVMALVADYTEPKYDLQAGLYAFDKFKGYGSNSIGSLGGMYYIGNFGVGATYLYSSESAVNGGTGGYVVTLKYGRNRSWVPGTYELFAKYYNQPDTTYTGHTMVGLADYMQGFSGFGGGMYYTLAENLIYGIEYYDLEEKGTGLRGRTLWNHISLFF
jgi:hypothetical protein